MICSALTLPVPTVRRSRSYPKSFRGFKELLRNERKILLALDVVATTRTHRKHQERRL
jgi:hypothetical protein